MPAAYGFAQHSRLALKTFLGMVGRFFAGASSRISRYVAA
jgi:hypothetical protein